MSDFEDIINTLISEANGEGPEGMRRVAETMINRSAIRGLSLGDIVRQPSQYTGLKHPGADAVQAQHNPTVRQTALEALQLALQPGDPTNGADHYLNPKLANPNWASQLPTTGDYENHRFFASRAVPQDALANVLSSSSNLFGPRAAPTPASPQQQISARGGNVLSGTFGTGANPGALSPTTQQSIANMFGGDNSARSFLQRNDNVMSPAAQVFGGQMEKNIFAGGVGSVFQDSAVGGPPTTRSVTSVPMPARTASTAAPTKIDGIGAKVSFDDLAAAFGGPRQSIPSANGTIVASKGQERLPSTSGPRANASAPGQSVFGGLNPNLVRTTPVPRPVNEAAAARVPKPSFTTETVANPAYESMKRQIEAGTLSYNGLSRDSVAARAAGQAMVAKLKAQMAITPPTITVKKAAPKIITVQNRSVPAAPLRITVRGAAPAGGMSAVDQLRAQGYSPSQASSMANANAAQRASAGGKYTKDNASNNGGRGSGPGGSLRSGDRSYDAKSNSWY